MAEDIPIEKLYAQPIVQELLEKINKPKDLENVRIPYLIKNKVLMSPGVWNNYYYSSEAIKEAYLKTEWNNKEIRSLFLDHLDKNSREWVGEVINPQMKGEDVIGDLVIVDKPMAQKLEYGAKLGISPKVHGEEDNNKMLSFLFDNFSIVVNPAVKTAYINNMEVNQKMAEETKVIPKTLEVATEPQKKELEEAPKEEPKEEVKVKEEPKKKLEEEEPKVEAPVKEAEPAAPSVSEGDELMETLSELEVKNGVADVAKKAKEIRKEGEKWVDAIKRAAKMMSEAETKLAEKPKEEPEVKEEEKEKPAETKMADSDVVAQIVKLAALLEKKKYPEPVKKEEEEAKPEEEEMKEKINELSEKVNKLTIKLNEPDKISKKTEELSVMSSEELVERSPDRAMLNILGRL